MRAWAAVSSPDSNRDSVRTGQINAETSGMTTAVVIQARIGSSRLPGKILRSLGARTPLAYVLRRALRIPGIDVAVCAIPEGVENDDVAAAARACGAAVFRGPEDDVLARYWGAARAVGARTVMRITSDCPLIDPMLCGEVLDVLAETGADFVSNSMPPLWPHGLDCEAFPTEHLARAACEALPGPDREHVTPWLKRNPQFKRINVDGPGGGVERHRWTLDFPEDYAFFRALWAVMDERAAAAGTEEILATLAAHPDLAAINRGRIDKARLVDHALRLERRVPSRLLVPA